MHGKDHRTHNRDRHPPLHSVSVFIVIVYTSQFLIQVQLVTLTSSKPLIEKFEAKRPIYTDLKLGSSSGSLDDLSSSCLSSASSLA